MAKLHLQTKAVLTKNARKYNSAGYIKNSAPIPAGAPADRTGTTRHPQKAVDRLEAGKDFGLATADRSRWTGSAKYLKTKPEKDCWISPDLRKLEAGSRGTGSPTGFSPVKARQPRQFP